MSGSACTLAVSVARFTVTSCTPGTAASARSTFVQAVFWVRIAPTITSKGVLAGHHSCGPKPAAIATALARMPADAGRPGVNAGITFTVPRNTARRPSGRALEHLLERTRELRAGAEALLEGETAEKALRRLGHAEALLDGSRSPDA